MPWDYMPTIVEKGPLFRDLEQFLKGHGNRVRMLRVLNETGELNTGANGPAKLVDDLLALVGSSLSTDLKLSPYSLPAKAPAAEARTFLMDHWFTEATTKFRMLRRVLAGGIIHIEFKPTQAELNDAAEILRIGLMDALEASMGVKKDWRSNAATTLPDDRSLTRIWPIEINWVCGKGDGFEIVTAMRRLPASSWHLSLRGILSSVFRRRLAPYKGGIITVNIVTPPIKNQVKVLTLPAPNAKDDIGEVKTKRSGMTVTRKFGNVVDSIYLPASDGGSNFP